MTTLPPFANAMPTLPDWWLWANFCLAGLVIGGFITTVGLMGSILRPDGTPRSWKSGGWFYNFCYVLGGSIYFSSTFTVIQIYSLSTALLFANTIFTLIWPRVIFEPTSIPRLFRNFLLGGNMKIEDPSPADPPQPLHTHPVVIHPVRTFPSNYLDISVGRLVKRLNEELESLDSPLQVVRTHKLDLERLKGKLAKGGFQFDPWVNQFVQSKFRR